jgi:FkbM family methyltransferase
MVRVPDIGKFQLRRHSDDLWHVLPSREQAVTDAVKTILAPGDCFVDAGANIGFYSILAAHHVGLSGRVLSVEMMPDTATILRDHVALNALEQIEVIEKALSDSNGKVITAIVEEGKYGQASIANALDLPGGRAIQVNSTTLDSILNGIDSIKLMKLDLEGAESLALKGAKKSLKKTRYVIFEHWNECSEVEQFLTALGFIVTNLDGRNGLASRA